MLSTVNRFKLRLIFMSIFAAGAVLSSGCVPHPLVKSTHLALAQPLPPCTGTEFLIADLTQATAFRHYALPDGQSCQLSSQLRKR